MKKVGIIDYGQGNIYSISKAIQKCNTEFIITENTEELSSCSHIILPGVGAFPSAMQKLKEKNLVNYLRGVVSEKPIMGICLGAQLCLSRSFEIEETEGLGLIKGDVVPFMESNVRKTMNVGWRKVYSHLAQESSEYESNICDQEFYFVHRYHFENCDADAIKYYSQNDDFEFVCAVEYDNILACQFHPEKSRDIGLKLIQKFINK